MWRHMLHWCNHTTTYRRNRMIRIRWAYQWMWIIARIMHLFILIIFITLRWLLKIINSICQKWDEILHKKRHNVNYASKTCINIDDILKGHIVTSVLCNFCLKVLKLHCILRTLCFCKIVYDRLALFSQTKCQITLGIHLSSLRGNQSMSWCRSNDCSWNMQLRGSLLSVVCIRASMFCWRDYNTNLSCNFMIFLLSSFFGSYGLQ